MNHSVLHPAGIHAAQIIKLGWLFLGVSGVVYLVVIAVLVVVLIRRRRSAVDPASLTQGERRALMTVGVAVGITTILVTGLAISDFLARRVLETDVGDPINVRIIGHQWWWDIEYESPVPGDRVHTANELHIPVGRPVRLEMTSQDVIHSFWVPNLHGKRDLIPGRNTTITLMADRPGRYEGQCAEFCGFQHAKMRIVVNAEPEEAFNAWKAAQSKPAQVPATDQQRRGREVFEHSQCVMCHSIQGTEAGGTLGPDLTHLASRTYIGAGALPNDRSSLESWIAHPPSYKPGTVMPSSAFAATDLAALTDYLASLR
jgi:cytochrome c oxidase subunit 2